VNKHAMERIQKLARTRCIIGNGDCGGRLEIHHLTDGGRRLGDLFTIPLCFNHHQAQSPLPVGEAYHKGKKTFMQKYGNNQELLQKANKLLEGFDV